MAKGEKKGRSLALYETILKLKDLDECCRFFDDLCTVPELKALSQRLQVAKMLSEHKVYSDIVQETGASTATISRINRCIQYGNGGYASILNRIHAGEE